MSGALPIVNPTLYRLALGKWVAVRFRTAVWLYDQEAKS